MKFSLSLLLLGVLISGCLKTNKGCPYKDSDETAPDSEQQQVEAYLSANGLNAIRHASGFYYQVINPGATIKPDLCSVVTVGYVGRLANGTIFDQQNIISFELGGTIEGWKKGLPLIQKGGKMKLYIPPSLGYGPYDVKDSGVVVIPANSMLIFDVELFEVN